jgi:UDP-N-acetylmuramoyl-tripeptide--D-alanyl-D-alanine ligase
MQGAMDTLKTLSGRKLAVFGDMKEQGSISQVMHDKVLRYAAPFIEKIFLVGPEWTQVSLPPNCYYFLSKEDLLSALKQTVQEGDAILIKGSNSHKLWTTLEEF